MAVQTNPFDELAPYYDLWFATPVGARVGALERDLLLRLARPLPGERVLEVGVGTGYFARSVLESGGVGVGLDLSLPMLEAAARKGLPLTLLQGDALALPFQPEQFDLVYSVTMLEFVPDPARAVAQMWGALRPRGRLVVAVLNRWSPWACRRTPPFDQAHLFTPLELKRLLRPYGRVHWSSSVFFMPDGRGLDCADRLEACGRKHLRSFGALLVAKVSKKAQPPAAGGRSGRGRRRLAESPDRESGAAEPAPGAAGKGDTR
ncbi:MAG: class I SAM-dependent methyltransferase [Anaerolineae bacterium]|nr:class I SAM-dependent methyltransferase [Anaerolineae bacterium]